MIRTVASVALAGWFCCVAGAPPAPAATLKTQCEKLAAQVAQITGPQPVQIGEFRPIGLDANFGPGLEERLRSALEAAQARVVDSNGVFEISGAYAFAKADDGNGGDGRRAVRIKALVVRLETFETVAEIPLTVDDAAESAEVIGLTGTLVVPKQDDVDRRRVTLEELVERPTTVIVDGTRVAPESGSPYAVEVMAGPSTDRLRPRRVSLDDRKAYVDFNTGEVCRLRISNRSAEPVAVKVSLDGLNNFHFADDVHRDDRGELKVGPHYRIEAGMTAEIAGWFLRLDGPNNYQAFSVVEYGTGAATAAGLASSGRIGVIHVQFANLAPPPTPPPAVIAADDGFDEAPTYGVPTTGAAAPNDSTQKGPVPTSLPEPTYGAPAPNGPQEFDRGEDLTVDQSSVQGDVEPPFAFVTIRYNRPR